MTRIITHIVNVASEITVGMTNKMLPNNKTEVIDGTIATIKNPDIDTDGLMEYIKGPDFPTGGVIYGIEGVKEAFETGRGRVVVRAKSEIITDNNGRDRKSTRLNSSHVAISYAVFCLKK